MARPFLLSFSLKGLKLFWTIRYALPQLLYRWGNWVTLAERRTELGYLAAQASNLAMPLHIRQALHYICDITLNYIYSMVSWCRNLLHQSVLQVIPSACVPGLRKTRYGIAKVSDWHRVLALGLSARYGSKLGTRETAVYPASHYTLLYDSDRVTNAALDWVKSECL